MEVYNVNECVLCIQAYREEQEKREAEDKKRNEMQAISRWYQLLSSVVTRQRLKNRYGKSLTSHASTDEPTTVNKSMQVSVSRDNKQSRELQQGNKRRKKSNDPPAEHEEEHKHVFLTEDQSFDEENLVITKRCHCGFSVQVEEL